MNQPVPATISSEDAQYAWDIVHSICETVGPGLPGTPQERERASILKRELETHLGPGNVVVEEFSVAPGAFLSPLPTALMLVAALLNVSVGRLPSISPWLTALLALALAISAGSLSVLEFILSHEVIDPWLTKKQSINVIGTLRQAGTGSVKRLLILSGHHDSALELTWLRLLGYGFFFTSVTMLLGYLAVLVMSLVQVWGMITGNADTVRIGTLGWLLLAYPVVPAIVFGLFATRGGKGGGIVPGAVDNLSASALAVAMCRFLVRNPTCIPADTEIRFISFGSEEAGLRGSRRYVERHLDELKRLNARLLNMEMVAHPEITILTSDIHGTLKSSPAMVESVVRAAERAGVPYKVRPASFGVATDAAPFTRAGLRAMTLFPFKVPQQTVAFYHQRRDGPEALAIEPLLNVLKLALEWVRQGGE